MPRPIMDPAVVATYVDQPVPPALRLDEARARAIVRQLDELRRFLRAAENAATEDA